ncbi:hypothetical protein RI367_001928 [Sorochytrium milnesiophthora]
MTDNTHIDKNNTGADDTQHITTASWEKPSFERFARSWRAWRAPAPALSTHGNGVGDTAGQEYIPAPIPPELGRFVTMTFLGSMWGFAMGTAIGARRAGMQYLAENAHRLPVTKQGWYFYHKTKNYRILLGSVQHGARYALRIGSIVALFSATEIGLDLATRKEEMWSTAMAGAFSATVYALTTRLPPASRKRAITAGTTAGVLIGAAQQYTSEHLGRSVKYFERGVMPYQLAVPSDEDAALKVPLPRDSRETIEL